MSALPSVSCKAFISILSIEPEKSPWPVILTVLLPSLGVTVRRLNDVNRSGWWVLLVFTLIGIIPLFYWCLIKESKSE